MLLLYLFIIVVYGKGGKSRVRTTAESRVRLTIFENGELIAKDCNNPRFDP